MKLVIFSLLAWQVFGQAPGDYMLECRIRNLDKTFPKEVVILMDTNDYISVLGRVMSPWLERSLDGDTITVSIQ